MRYVSRETIGYEDLDQYGVWRQVPPYGWVWAPAGMAAGWAPYRYGHWVWVDPWGWTWIDDAPWGFAPFHYGRWAFAGGAGWVWVPGAMAARPVYAPALVAFVGVGGVGMAAWFPLGPGEVYRPGPNVRYVNQGVVGAVTVVPHDAFVGARPVARAMVIVPQREIVQAQVVGSTARHRAGAGKRAGAPRGSGRGSDASRQIRRSRGASGRGARPRSWGGASGGGAGAQRPARPRPVR